MLEKETQWSLMPVAECPLWAEMGFACSHQCMGTLQWEIMFLLRETHCLAPCLTSQAHCGVSVFCLDLA